MAAQLRKTGIKVVGDIPWGTHFCIFYETKEDLFDILIPYLKTGLENKELCVLVISPPQSEEETKQALRRAIPDVDQRLAAGDIEIVSHTDQYLKSGTFDLPRVIGGWQEKLTQALFRGYSGMRITAGEGVLLKDDHKVLLAYEKELNKLIANQRMIILCPHPLGFFRAPEFLDIARAHELAAARRQGKWEVLETPELSQAKAEISRLSEELEQRVVESSRQLEAARAEIVEREQIEKQLSESEARMQAAIHAAGVGLWDWDLISGQMIWLGHHGKLFGFDEDEFGGTYADLKKRIHPDDLEEFERVVQRARDQGSEYAHEYRVVWPDGSIHWIAGQGRFMYDDTGRPVRMRGAVWDISKRREAEEALRKSEFDLLEAQRIARIGSWSFDIATNTVRWSEELFKIFEVGETAFDGTYEAFFSTVHPDDRPRVLQMTGEARSCGESFEGEYRITTRSGQVKHIHEVGYARKDRSGVVLGLFGTAQDITERKRMEEKLGAMGEQLRALAVRVQSVREEEGRRIGRELHDEVGSAMTSLKWDLEGVNKLCSEARNQIECSTLLERIGSMIGLIDRTSRTVQRISSELRPSVLHDLGLIAGIEWQSQQFEARSGISCRFESLTEWIDLEEKEATGVFRIIQEALTNILRHSQATEVNITVEKEEGALIFQVRDNGRGITEEEMTRPSSLGLMGMQERAHLMGGTVGISGSPGKGTVVTVRVPISSERTPHLSLRAKRSNLMTVAPRASEGG